MMSSVFEACWAFLLAMPGVPQVESDRERLDFFEAKVRPIFAERCYACHSAGAGAVKGGLLLDTREGILKGGDSGPAVVPGDPDRSPLVRAIRNVDDDARMPPKTRLAPEQVGAIEAWVRIGAPVPADRPDLDAKLKFDFAAARKAWPFAPIVASPPPEVKDAGWARTAVDRFILAKLEENGLRPTADADRRTLLRRATFDLTGLPPTPEEVDAFLSDPSPDAFQAVVDRLLASPRYGERWGRHWLDLVRYADTAGDSADYPIPQAHKYRDYVIAAFNEDKPYGRFLREQVAGDLLPASSEKERREGIVATGFLALARRFGEDPAVDHHLTIDDTIDTLGRTMLGLTLSCARCHDHKFDPITVEDYYGLYGIFQSTRYPRTGGDKMKYQADFVPLIPVDEARRLLRPFEERLAALDAEAKPLEEEIAAVERASSAGSRSTDRRSIKDLRKALDDVRKKREAAARERPAIDDACAVGEGVSGPARMHLQGNPKALGRETPRRFLEVLGGQPMPAGAKGSGRLHLAEWLSDPGNPLPARVMVNRIWQHRFGKGIVQTPGYFGKQGLPPTHPELLDWLASEFIRTGGSIKSMHRLLMRSRVYGLASVGRGENARADGANDLLWKFRRRRLDAEAIRDSLLAVAGALDLSPAGAHPFPSPKDWTFSKASPFYAVYPTERRSIYLMQQRLKRHPFLALFDGPDPNASTAERFVTTTPLQSLYMLNSPFVREQAVRLAARLRSAGLDGPAAVDGAHRLAFGRPATAEEIRQGEAFLEEGGRSDDAWTGYAKVLLSSSEFIHVD